MAARFWIGGGTNANWNASPTTNWAATSGDTVRVAAPGAGDDVTFDGVGATANSASTMQGTTTILSLTITAGYTNTITHSATLTIAGNWTFHSGYTIAGTGAITISAASTIDSNGKTWPNALGFSGTNTKTLSENLSVTGQLTISGSSTVINGNTLNVAGGLVMSQTCSGTTVINLTGGTWSGGSAIQNSITIAGNVTLSGAIAYNTGILTYSSGTVTTTSSTLSIGASTTLNTAGISFNNVTFSATGTITINSLLTVSATLQIANAAIMTFAGTIGFICAILNDLNTSARVQTFKNGITYTITSQFLAFRAPNTAPSSYTSDDGTLKTIITLQNASTVCNTNANMTRVDASGGRPIITFNATVTTSFNCFLQTNVLYRPMESFNRGGRRVELLNKNKSVIYQ